LIKLVSNRRAARLVPGERRERRKYRSHMFCCTGTPKADSTPTAPAAAALDAEILFIRANTLVLLLALPAGNDAPVERGDDVLPDLLVGIPAASASA